MKIKQDYNLENLLEYGFIKIDKEEEKENENWTISTFDYSFEIGHSRRGQYYFLLLSEKSRTINIYASEPDGNGGIITAPNILIKMSLDGIFE